MDINLTNSFHKDFTGWGVEKKRIDENGSSKFLHIREIGDAKVGINVGSEVCGKGKYMRPVLVVKRIGSVYLVLPLTTKGKDNHILYHAIQSIDFQKPSYLLLAHIKTIDPKRCIKCIGTISKGEFLDIQKKLQHLCFGS